MKTKIRKKIKAEIREDFPKFFESELPRTWEEYTKIKKYEYETTEFTFLKDDDYMKFWGDAHYIPKKYVALRKLELLRDYYNDNTKTTDTWRYYIRKYLSHSNADVELKINYSDKQVNFLGFKTKKNAYLFLKNFKDLIEQAEDLI